MRLTHTRRCPVYADDDFEHDASFRAHE